MIFISKKDVLAHHYFRFSLKGKECESLEVHHLDNLFYQISGNDEGDDQIKNNIVQFILKEGNEFIEENGVHYPLNEWLHLHHLDGDFMFDSISIFWCII